MGVTDITVGVGATPILSASDPRSAPPVLFNAGAEDITLTYGSDTDSFVLEPGKTITAPAYHDVSGTVLTADTGTWTEFAATTGNTDFESRRFQPIVG